MSNPLRKQPEEQPPTGGYSEDYLLRLCDRENRWARRIGFRQWNYVEPGKNGMSPQAMRADGVTAEEVWMIWDGRRVEYHQWPQEKLDKVNRRARWLLKQGLIFEGSAAA